MASEAILYLHRAREFFYICHRIIASCIGKTPGSSADMFFELLLGRLKLF